MEQVIHQIRMQIRIQILEHLRWDKIQSPVLSIAIHTLFALSIFSYSFLFTAPEFWISAGSSAIEIALYSPVHSPAQTPVPVIQKSRHAEFSTTALSTPADLLPQNTNPSSSSGATTESTAYYLKNTPPVYPERAKLFHQEGTVYVRAEITADGLVKSLALEKSSGFNLLDESALNAVKKWQFAPAKRGGINVEASVLIPIRFEIEKNLN